MVTGFVFSKDMSKVLLIKKRRPEWQLGLLNGVGGRAEPDDKSPRATMTRELREETGLAVAESAWVMFAEHLNPFENLRVVFFYAMGPVARAKTMTDEVVRVCDTSRLASYKLISNLYWLIPLAIGWEEQNPPLENVILLRRKPLQ